MKYVLLYPGSFAIDTIADALEAEQVAATVVDDPSALAAEEEPTAFLLDPASRDYFPPERLERFVRQGGAILVLGAPEETEPPQVLPDEDLAAFVPHPAGRRAVLIALRGAYREAAARRDAQRARLEAQQRTRELGELTQIGMALTTERDYRTLLNTILTQAVSLTSSDGGSLYIVETGDDEPSRLRLSLARNLSRPDMDATFVEFTMPLNTASIGGYVATTGEPLVIDDVYFLPPDEDYSFNLSMDKKHGYRSKSMLTIPMKDHKDEVIGVLQLINRKRQADAVLATPEDCQAQVIPYSQRQVDLVSALAGQAAVSIENSLLYEDIEHLFEGFVKAAVTAIEQRDPTTFGHSGRVASMTVALAETVDQCKDGKYAAVRFSREEIKEIRYAGLLHDFGKVGVREQVLVKAKKLYPPDMALVKQRYAFIRRTVESEYHRRRADYLEQQGQDGYQAFLQGLEAEHHRRLEDLDHFMELVTSSNEPTVLPEGSFEELLAYAERYYADLEGAQQPYITDDEVRYLTIRKGSLDESERLEIESHVTHTYRFLLQIPWTKELQFIPNIAYGHHEKLNGSGYPRKVNADQIPIQTRMMTISDIFDALTASDRPYKRAVPVPRAFDILADETGAGMLDPELFRLFHEGKVHERASESGAPA